VNLDSVALLQAGHLFCGVLLGKSLRKFPLIVNVQLFPFSKQQEILQLKLAKVIQSIGES
jgi:hypothetical protein